MNEPPTTRSTAPRTKPSAERRTYWIAGLVLFGSIVALIAISLITTSYGPRKDTQGQLQEQGGAKPHIIQRPGEGQAPEHPNDRGGWQQFLVLGLIVVAVSTVGGLAWRSSRQARAKAATVHQPPDARSEHHIPHRSAG